MAVVDRLTGGLGQLSTQRQGGLHPRPRVDPRSPDAVGARGRRRSADRIRPRDSGHRIEPGHSGRLVPRQRSRHGIPRGRSSCTMCPRALLVIGGGYIGLELGTAYAALGSRVTVVEMTGGLLPGADRDLVNPVAKRMASLLEAIWLETTVVRMDAAGDGIAVTLEGQGGRGVGAGVRPGAGRGRPPGRTRRSTGSTRRGSSWTRAASCRWTLSGGPPSRRSSRSGTWWASRCWRTRRHTKAGWWSR